MNQLAVSFIIPTYNEEYFLPKTLEHIIIHAPKSLSYEIIVADNGSEDNSIEIAKKHAKVLVDKNATIGGLRNLAVNLSKGNVLIFLDADISLTGAWSKHFLSTYESILTNPYQVTGSRCTIPTPASWIEKSWFKPLLTQSSKYINSGHLITSRKLFNQIGGFDSKLETGEDYALGKAALQVNATIVNNPILKVVHEGYPKSIRHFVKREIWHGKGDFGSLKNILSSNVALAAITFFFLHLILLISIITMSYSTTASSLFLIALMCSGSAIMKHKARKISDILQIGFLYYLYFSSRFLSCIPLLNKRPSRYEAN